MAHVSRSDMAPGLRLEGVALQKLDLFRNQTILSSLGFLSWAFFRLIPSKWLGGETVSIAGRGGKTVRATVFKGKGYEKNEGPRFAVLWIHGGGFVLGGPNMMPMTFAKKLLDTFNCILLMPDYSLTWKAPHPAQIEECWASLLWLRDHANDYGVTKEKLIVGGESAGGGLTAALCLYARDHGSRDIGLQIPLYPMLDCLPTKTNCDNDAPVWNSVANDIAWALGAVREHLNTL